MYILAALKQPVYKALCLCIGGFQKTGSKRHQLWTYLVRLWQRRCSADTFRFPHPFWALVVGSYFERLASRGILCPMHPATDLPFCEENYSADTLFGSGTSEELSGFLGTSSSLLGLLTVVVATVGVASLFFTNIWG